MVFYLLKRIAAIPVILLAVLAAVFFLIHFSGNAVNLLLPVTATPHERAVLAQRLHLNDPLLQQFALFISGAAHGNLGESYFYKEPVTAVILDHLPATLLLASTGMALAIATGLGLGIVAAVREGSVLDSAIVSGSVFGQSMPSFWLGMMLIIVLAVRWHLLPTAGIGGIRHLALPAITVAAFQAPQILLLTRSSTLDVLAQPYIVAAKAKGLSGTIVVWRHALRNAINPVLASIGLQFGTLLGGSIITETLFAWPGVGRLSVQAIFTRDMPLVEGCVFTLALGVLLCNLTVDVLNAVIDPRVRAT